MSDRWQFWIDVGGTFTDCIGRDPSGQLHRAKVLSSGVTKGSVTSVSGASLIDTRRRRDPSNFWQGFRCTLLYEQGRGVASGRVTQFDSGAGRLEVAWDEVGVAPRAGQSYELSADIDAPLLAIRWLLGLPLSEPLPAVSVRLGTTRGTNALLTRRGARTAFVTTRGFGDILRIGYQNRPHLFALNIQKPAPLFAVSLEVDECVAADGTILQPLDEAAARETLRTLHEQGIESLAICLLHGYRQPVHEQALARIAREVGFTEISLSHQVAPLIKLVARGDTTVVDAYLNPILRTYLARLQGALGAHSDLQLLTSAGGLMRAEAFRGKDSILSGPAGGVVGFSRVAEAAGFARSIGFDMGGTSTDVARYDGRYELQYETEKAGVRVVSPMLAIHTVAAGGGSLCWFDGVKLCVGPESAGADPGPACYGRGGPLTVTDCNLYLGRLLPAHFPFVLDRARVQALLEEMTRTVADAAGVDYTPQQLAAGFLQVANANMAQAIRNVSTTQGYDPREYVLVAFGGAAAQHACAIAEELGMTQILHHPDASLLSAYGMGLADIVWHEVQGVTLPADAAGLVAADEVHRQLAQKAIAAACAQGAASERVATSVSLDMRYRGTDTPLTIAAPEDGDYVRAFTAEHQRRYGYVHAGRAVEIVAVRVMAVGKSDVAAPRSTAVRGEAFRAAATTQLYVATGEVSAALVQRDQLAPGDSLSGPAVIVQSTSTMIVEPGWQAEMLSGGELLLRKVTTTATAAPLVEAARDIADPVQLEIFNHHFAGIAERMGITLRNTSSSVNVKERLDFSCALFTATGDLVVNAPHIPVHLGAMGETVKQVIARRLKMTPGDVYVTNDPYRGGSHLPDVTVISPVHDLVTGELRFFTASRAHHAEIGGITPGSMPPFSANLAEEGVLIRDFALIEEGQVKFEALRELLAAPPYPSRAIADNLADVAAQVAANSQGVYDLLALVERYTWPVVHAYMQHIQAAAEQKTRAALAKLPRGVRTFRDHLDDGTPIVVTLTINGDSATIDFTGTGPVSPGNLNANRAIVTAAVLYVLRLLIDEDIPLNQGVLAPVQIVLPEDCLLNPREQVDPRQSPAVVGGNVETSQRVVDVLLGALGLAAASQGTMNNLLFGDETFGYYETICGGAGATHQAAGASAVHTHMTNTRLTDPEVLELRYPVRLREFRIRSGSGGAGTHRGGDGVVRAIEFLRGLRVSLLTQRRGPYAPYGLKGGQPGALGRNTWQHADGRVESLPGSTHFTASAGDVLIIETPGGGGA